MPEFYVPTFWNNLSNLHRQKFEIKNNSPLWEGNCKTHSIIRKTRDQDNVSTDNSDAGESTKRKNTTSGGESTKRKNIQHRVANQPKERIQHQVGNQPKERIQHWAGINQKKEYNIGWGINQKK
jgi:hypothetical protein